MMVKGESTKIKTITIDDGTARAKVTLWRKLSDADTRPGNHVTISDVIINVYQNNTTLSTTARSTVQV